METQKYKIRIEEMLKKITEELKTIGVHNPKNPADWIAVPENSSTMEPDLNDAADKIEDWNERRALVAILETRYNNIKKALKNIEEDSYGMCDVCKNEIEKERLNANPVARTCMTHLEESTK